VNISFDPFRFETATGRLWCGLEEVRLTPKAAAVLGALVAKAGEPVSKENLFATVWAGRVVSDDALISCIQELRRALDDEPKQPRYIETRHRRGYRFVAPLSHPPAAAADRAIAKDLMTDRSGMPMISVLPFDNISGDPGLNWLSGALTHDTISALSRFRSLQLIADGRGFSVPPRDMNERRAALHLGAGHLVGGSIGKTGNCIRIRAHLIEAATGRYLWAEQFDREAEAIQLAHDEIIAAIAARVEPVVARQEYQLALLKTEPARRARDCLQLGIQHFLTFSSRGNREAQDCFVRAAGMDRTLAQNYSWLSYSRIVSMICMDGELSRKRIGEAVAMARNGVVLDEQDGFAHFVLGHALLVDRAGDDALLELKAAIELNPSLPVAHFGLGEALIHQGRLTDAIASFERAIELNPYDPQRGAFLASRALAHLLAGDVQDALEWSLRASRVPSCHVWPLAHQVCALTLLRRTAELRSAMAELMSHNPAFSCSWVRDRLFQVGQSGQLSFYLHCLRNAGARD
jgi:TolB-like protein